MVSSVNLCQGSYHFSKIVRDFVGWVKRKRDPTKADGCWVSCLKRQFLHLGRPQDRTGSPTYTIPLVLTLPSHYESKSLRPRRGRPTAPIPGFGFIATNSKFVQFAAPDERDRMVFAVRPLHLTACSCWVRLPELSQSVK